MTSLASKDEGFRPHKRTGVWSTETIRQKSGIPERITNHPQNESFESTTSENEDDVGISSTKTNLNDVIKTHMKSKLLKLPVFDNCRDINIGLLLTQFNDEEDVKDVGAGRYSLDTGIPTYGNHKSTGKVDWISFCGVV